MGKEVKIKITVDGKQVEKSVKDLTKEFNIAEKSVAEINQRLKELKEASQQVATGSEEFRELNEEIRRLNLETKQAAGSLNELGQREPLSNVRKGFEDTAFAITSVNTVLGIANELFSGNEKIQKIINRTQLAFNAILTATQLIKEKEGIIDGVRNVRLVAYNALLPVATNLTRIFGITTSQAMAAATAGVSLLVTGFAILVSTLFEVEDANQQTSTTAEETNNKLLTQLELQTEIARLRGDESEVNRLTISQLERKLIPLQGELDKLNEAKKLQDLLGVGLDKERELRRQNLIQQTSLIKAEIEGLRNKEKSNKSLEKQRDLQKEISDFIVKNRIELVKNLSNGLAGLNDTISGFTGDIENRIIKYFENIGKFSNSVSDSFEEAANKIKEFEDALSKGLTDEQRKRLIDLNKEYDRLGSTLKAIKNPIKDIEKTLTDFEFGKLINDLNKIFDPLINLQEEIKKNLGEGALPELQSSLDSVGFSANKAALFIVELSEKNFELTNDLIDLQKQINKGGLSDEKLKSIYVRINEITNERITNSNSINEIQKQSNELISESVDVSTKSFEREKSSITNKQILKDNQIAYNNSLIAGIQIQIEELKVLDVLTKQQTLFIELAEQRIKVLQLQNEEIMKSFEEPEQQLSRFTQRFDEINKKSDSFFEKYRGEIALINNSLQTLSNIAIEAGNFRIAKIEEETRIMEERYDRELELLNRVADEDATRIQNSLLSEEVKSDAIRAIREREANDQRIIELRREAERKKLERQRNLAQQRSSIAQATMQAALAIIQAFAQLGPIAGAIAAAGVGITTGLQIATIKKQRFNRGGKVKGPGSSMSDSIPALLSNGESVINANSTKMFEPLLSKINEIGGGVRFNRGGVAGDTPTMAQTEIVDIEKLAQRIGDELRNVPMKAYVVANEVTNQQEIDAQIRRKSTI